jgi:hypothetical protein
MKKIDLSQNFTHQNILSEISECCYMNDLTYIDGVIYWCEINNVEIEYISDIIKKNTEFKTKIQYEAEDLNFLKKPKRLPL